MFSLGGPFHGKGHFRVRNPMDFSGKFAEKLVNWSHKSNNSHTKRQSQESQKQSLQSLLHFGHPCVTVTI